jgi:hypothetical protein
MTTGYPFLDYILEDKSRYKKASEAGYVDPYDLFLIGDSGGFLMNINPQIKFVNTHLFTEMADYYRENNEYTSFKPNSIAHTKLRKREQYRRKHGFDAPCLLYPDGTIHNCHITGSHYNFLNYTRMERLDESSIIQGNKNVATKHFDFPKFIDAQYWTFHVMEFVKNNGFHLIIDKTRRGGFSYIMASDSANTVNCNSRKVVIHVAADSKYLTDRGGLTDFAISDIRFYEEKSPFVRGILSTTKEDFRLGYKLRNGVEADNSWKSALLSVSAHNNPDCAIGKDAVVVKVEELSTMENFDDFMNVTEPAMRTGSFVTGTLMAWGTATSGNMQVFEQNFYNPLAFHFMPFENVWDRDARSEVCGFFKPYCWGLEGLYQGVPGMDKDGNSNLSVGLQIAKQERLDKKASSKSYADYINYLGQYALMPSESFSSASENIFSSEELTAWEDRLRIDSDLRFYTDGMFDESKGKLEFVSNARLAAEGKTVYDWIQGVPRRGNEDPHGCVRIWFFPEYIERITPAGKVKEIPEGLYSITYDPVGVDKEKNEITNKHSHNSISVWMNPHAINGFKSKKVAAYYGRPDRLEEADMICYQLARFYNCKGTTNVEINRGETVSNFKKWGATSYLAFEPVFVWDASIQEAYSKTYGYSIGDNAKKLNAIRLLKEYLYEEVGKDEEGNPVRNFHLIYDYQAILELKKWNSKGNFDRVSEMLLRGIEWKAAELKGLHDLENRQPLTAENIEENDILNRDWF